MRVSKQKSAENRVVLLNAASRLFRERGIEGVGVAEIAKEAGLTHGALYAHFPSKDALVAEAFRHGFDRNVAGASDQRATFEEHLGGLLSTQMRDDWKAGCPMAASASEIGRQGCAVSESFTQALEQMATMIEGSLGDSIPPSKRRSLALAAVAAEIGAIAASRAIAKTNPALADEVLQAVRETVCTAYKAEKATSTKAKRR
jgi:TetR/AcrR family transcriptional regulator, transcriptional repressor for nem operon